MYKIVVLFLLISFLQLTAQRPKRNYKIHKSIVDTLEIHYHRNHKISTEARWDKDMRFGKFKCFDAKGKLLFELHLRKLDNRNFHGNLQYSTHPTNQQQVDFQYLNKLFL